MDKEEKYQKNAIGKVDSRQEHVKISGSVSLAKTRYCLDQHYDEKYWIYYLEQFGFDVHMLFLAGFQF